MCQFLLVGILILSSVGAVASHRSTAEADPSPLRAGEEVSLVFDVGGPDRAEVVVQERVNCTVTLPDGAERSPCAETGGLVEIRTENETRTYVVDYAVPDQVGTYQVAFEASSTVRVTPHDRSASTSFRVLDDLDPSPSDDGETEDPTEDPDEAPPEEPPAGDGPGQQAPDESDLDAEDEGPGRLDEARLVSSLTVATAAIAGGLVFARTETG